MSDPAPPTWVTKRDGRLVPFEADRISLALFGATETLGRPDAFLARELADGVVHFLAQEHTGETPTTADVAEVVVKVVRELGHPALAAVFEKVGQQRERGATTPITAETFSRELLSAERSGLLFFCTYLWVVNTLRTWVMGTGDSPDDRPQSVVIDGPDHSPGAVWPRRLFSRHTYGSVILNLNSQDPPAWAGDLAGGPLFPAPTPVDQERRELAWTWAREFLRGSRDFWRVDWHLGESDFQESQRPHLLQIVSLAIQQAPIAFVLDRPRRPVALAEGVDRTHPAVLMSVGLNLPLLAFDFDADRFIQRLGSLARLALSAGVQYREHLRRLNLPALSSGFLLDRARLMVVPLGLDAVVRHLTNWGLCNGGESLSLGRRIVGRLRDVLLTEGRAVQLDACVDGPASFRLEGGEEVAGLTPWDRAAPIRSQLRAAGTLHAVAEQGTMGLFGVRSPEEAIEALTLAWRQTEVCRVRIMPGSEG